jgi:hypothetical protein
MSVDINVRSGAVTLITLGRCGGSPDPDIHTAGIDAFQFVARS